MYVARASQFAKTITMACTIQKQVAGNTVAACGPSSSTASSSTDPLIMMPSTSSSSSAPTSSKSIKAAQTGPRGSLPSDTHRPPLDEFQWPPTPVSAYMSNLRLTMMNQDPKDLHTARLIIEELRTKVRYQTEHIMKWRKAYALQIQQHYRYQKEKSDQMNSLTSQLLLLESRIKRKQKQIALLLSHRELTIQRQQKIIDLLATRLLDNGLDACEANAVSALSVGGITSTSGTVELDSMNDSDSAVIMEDVDSDSNVITFGGLRRRSSGGGSGGPSGIGIDNSVVSSSGGGNSGGITIVRSISDAIETNLNKYGGVRRNNCFLRRPEILETVYSVEEDPEPATDVAEKRDKFRQRSEKALSSSSTEGQIDNGAAGGGGGVTAASSVAVAATTDKTKESVSSSSSSSNTISAVNRRQLSSATPLLRQAPIKDGYTACSMRVPQLQRCNTTATSSAHQSPALNVQLHVTAIAPLAVAETIDIPMEESDGNTPMLDCQLSNNGGSSHNGSTSNRNMAIGTNTKSQVTNYNRVMSNHRSVTKPKDVKYKRINKAKSKSLEELRGRLKNLVERGNAMDAAGLSVNNGYTLPQTAQSYA